MASAQVGCTFGRADEMITLVAVVAAPLVLALLLGAANAILAASASKTTCAPARLQLQLSAGFDGSARRALCRTCH